MAEKELVKPKSAQKKEPVAGKSSGKQATVVTNVTVGGVSEELEKIDTGKKSMKSVGEDGLVDKFITDLQLSPFPSGFTGGILPETTPVAEVENISERLSSLSSSSAISTSTILAPSVASPKAASTSSLSAPPVTSTPLPSAAATQHIIETMSQLDRAKVDPFKSLENEMEALSPLEKEVLAIAKEVLKKKKYDATIEAERVENMSDLVEQLYSKSIARLTHTKGFSKEDIFRAIQDLEKKRWIITDQRRTKEEVLESPTVRKVLSFIHDHPGTHARDQAIETELSITRNPFLKHVMVLEAFGLIRTKKIGRTQNYFVAGLPEVFDDFVVLFANPLVPDIIRLLLKDENIALSEIARQLNVYHGAIQYHIKALTEMGIVMKSESGVRVNRELLRRYNQMYRDPPFEY